MIDCSVHVLPFWSFNVKSGTRSSTCGPSFDKSILGGDWAITAVCANRAASSVTANRGSGRRESRIVVLMYHRTTTAGRITADSPGTQKKERKGCSFFRPPALARNSIYATENFVLSAALPRG